jgi:hypothetical protein
MKGMRQRAIEDVAKAFENPIEAMQYAVSQRELVLELLEALKTLIDVCDGNYRELTEEMRLVIDKAEGNSGPQMDPARETAQSL